MTERYFFTDTAHGELHYVGDDVTVDGENDVNASDLETVTLDSKWNDFFDTDEYVQFEATVAQPIVQPYFYDGELHYFRKDETELRQAQAQLDNLPWTVGHPPKDRVTTADQIRGFWSDAHYDGGQKATVNIPANDTEAIRFAVDNGDVSVGFSGTLDWVDADGKTDAVQRNMAYDHVASVENGRCPPERGCGLHTDDGKAHLHGDDHATNGRRYDESSVTTRHVHVHTDAVQTKMSEEDGMHGDMDPEYAEGDWVEWDWPPDSESQQDRSSDKSDSGSGGTARGRVTNVSTERSLTTSGTTRDPTEEGEPVYKIKHWSEGEWGNMKVAYESNLRSASQPENFSDTVIVDTCSALCSPGPCSCGLHDPFVDVEVNGEEVDLVPPEAVQNAAQDALDARANDDVTVNGMTEHGWSRAEQLASGEELSPSDIIGSSGAMAPWWSRHAQYSIEQGDTLSLAGADKDNPWEDNSYTSGKGWGGVAGYKWAIRKGNELKRVRDEEPNYEMVDSTHSPVTDATTVMDTITYEDTMGGDLDEPEIPNEGYEPHYVFDADTKSDSSFPLVDADGNLRRENVIAAASYSEDAPDEDFLMDVLREVNDAFEDPPLDEETVTTDTAPLAKHRVLADAAPTDDTMTNIQTFIDENDLTVADVIDALDVELEAIDGVPTEPTAFYDGEPDIEDLADDFPAVKMLADDKEDLEDEVDSLREDLRETKRPRYEEKVEELTSIADDAFGSEDDLLDAFDAEDEDERLTIDDIEDKIETAKAIRGAETTTAADSTSDDEDIDVDTTVSVADEDKIRSTEGGKLDLSSVGN
jgi:hypothetical protein